MKRFCLPEKMREELRKVYGTLYQGDEKETSKRIINELNNPSKIITVGDIVTYNFLNAGVIPDISFVDEKTKRGPVSGKIVKGTRHPDFKTITVENPPGVITKELLDVISGAMSSESPIRVFVDGEEDLAALPAIIMAPISSVIIYGLPEEGAVLVRVTKEKKEEIQLLLDRMKCMEEHNGN